MASTEASISAPRADRLRYLAIPSVLLLLAAAGWWWSARMAADMESMGSMGSMSSAGASMSFAAFVAAWVAMMAAMMFPAISPVVRLYARAAEKGGVAPVAFFVAGYLVVWSAVGIPAYFAWQELAAPLDRGDVWVGRLAGATLLVAAIYQLTPLKSMCLRHCRSPISFFLRHAGTNVGTPSRAVRLGATHGTFCLGCCWALMAVLVAVGTMNLAWMVALTVVIFVEKVAPRGERFAVGVAAALAVLAVVLLVDPATVATVT